MDFKLDENGKILDDDKIFDIIKEWHDDGEYEKIALTINAVPKEQWSAKLRLSLISAYNNMKRFEDSERELEEVYPLCKTPVQTAKYHYLRGYIYYTEDKEMMAVSCYKKGLEADPNNESKLDLDEEIKDCQSCLDNDLKKLGETAQRMTDFIKEACAKLPEDKKDDLNDEEFTMYLGYLSSIRKVPDSEKGLGFKKFFTKYKGEQKKRVLNYLADFGITDKDSLLEFYHKDLHCNLMARIESLILYLEGKPQFDLSKLNEEGKEAFLNAAEFFRPFYKLLPKAGVMAWDLCEKVGFIRLAYSCDLLKNSDYCTAMMYIADFARENFSSFEEYIISLCFGCGTYEFFFDDWSVKGAMKFMEDMLPFLLKGDLPYIRWGGEKH